MKELIEQLKLQLTNFERLSYVKDSGYVGYDPYSLVKLNRFPFFNITPISHIVERIDNISFKQLERRIYALSIQFATRNLKQNIAIMGNDDYTGLLDFQDDLWAGIVSDRTVNKTVDGILPGYSIMIDILELGTDERVFVAGAEMRMEFYKDVRVGEL